MLFRLTVCCIFLFEMQRHLVLSNMLLGKVDDRLYCVTSNDSMNSAITWVGLNEEVPRGNALEALCKISKTNRCSPSGTVLNSLANFAGPVLDRRWEDFQVIKTYGDNFAFGGEFTTNNLTVAFSIRLKDNAHVFLCHADNPKTSKCYYFVLNGWRMTTSVLRRCEKGIPFLREKLDENCYKYLAESSIPNVTSLSAWNHFILEKTNGNISIKRHGFVEPLLSYTDEKPLDARFLFFRSPNYSDSSNGFWKVHNYNFTELEHGWPHPTDVFRFKNGTNCVGVYFKSCSDCTPFMELLHNNNVRHKVYALKTDEWQYITFRADPGEIFSKEMQIRIYLENIPTGKKIYVGDITNCNSEGIVNNISRKFDNNTCCQALKLNQIICSTSFKRKYNYNNEPNCPSQTVGKDCIPCSTFSNCSKLKFCEFSNKDSVQCACATGYQGTNCFKRCAKSYYGFGCKNQCNTCNDKECNAETGECTKAQTRSNHNEQDLPVLKNAPKILQIGFNNVTIQIDPAFNGREKPEYYQIQFKQYSATFNSIDSMKYIFSDSSTKTINNLTSKTDYVIRIVLYTEEGQKEESEEIVPRAYFTTICRELSKEDVTAVVRGKLVNILVKESDEICPLTKYKIYTNYEMGLQNNVSLHYFETCSKHIVIIRKEKRDLLSFDVENGEDGYQYIQCLAAKNITERRATLYWSHYGYQIGDNHYVVEYEYKGNRACNVGHTENRKVITTSSPSVLLDNLIPFSNYSVTVKYLTERREIWLHTLSTDVPTPAEIPEIVYKQDGSGLSVFAKINNCTVITGANYLRSKLQCGSRWCFGIEQNSSTIIADNHYIHVGLFTVTGITNYTIVLTMERNNILLSKEKQIFTEPIEPGNVLQPKIHSTEKKSLHFRWQPPYPPNGILEGYRITYHYYSTSLFYNWGGKTIREISPLECSLWKTFHCASIDNLYTGYQYRIEIEAKNRVPSKYGPGITLFGWPEQKVPIAPGYLLLVWDDFNNLTFNFPHPDIPNGQIKTVEICVNSECTQTVLDQEKPMYSITKSTSTPAEKLNVHLRVKNYVGWSQYVQNITYSPPPIPALKQKANISPISNTTITITIPNIEVQKEVTCLLFVIVSNINTIVKSGYQTSIKEQTVFKESNVDYTKYHSWITHEEKIEATVENRTINLEIGEEMHISDPILMHDSNYTITILLKNIYMNISRTNVYKLALKTADVGSDEGESERDGSGSYFLLLLLLLIPGFYVIGFLVLRSKGIKLSIPALNNQRNTSPSNNQDRLMLTSRPLQLKPKPPIYQNASEIAEECEQFSRLVKLEDFEEYVKHSLQGEFERQHALFPRGQTKPWTHGTRPDNKAKNRYANLAAYDHTRVILTGDALSTDYINANYIDGYNHPKAFIATQGPKATTLGDFWHMVWQEKVKHIVMIANVVEGGKNKVAKYWPDINETLEFGGISVKYLCVDVYADYERRILSVNFNGEERKVNQFHFVSWPDHGVPLYVQSLAPFLKRILIIPQGSSPVLVHCSAGVGRTGTLILSDICLRMAAKEGCVDVLYHQYRLREQRPNMVDNLEQYKLVHLLLLHCLVGPDTGIVCSENMSYLVDELLASNEIAKQMKYLDDTKWQDDTMRKNTLKIISPIIYEKNRYRNVVPDECSRIILSRYPTTDEDSMYINAIRVNGFQQSAKYVVTQYPLKNTVGDFWRLIVENNITAAVCLNELNLEDGVSSAFYPTAEHPELIPVPFITVNLSEMEEEELFVVYTLNVTNTNRKKESFQMTLVQLNNWSYDRLCPKSPKDLVALYEVVNRIGKSRAHTLISCYDGVKASGLFASLCFLIDKIKLEQICDVCLAVRTVRHSRDEFVRDVEQFKFLFKSGLEYVLLFEMYSNFR